MIIPFPGLFYFFNLGLRFNYCYIITIRSPGYIKLPLAVISGLGYMALHFLQVQNTGT